MNIAIKMLNCIYSVYFLFNSHQSSLFSMEFVSWLEHFAVYFFSCKKVAVDDVVRVVFSLFPVRILDLLVLLCSKVLRNLMLYD